MKLGDVITLIVVISMMVLAVFLYFETTGPTSEVRDFKIWETPTPGQKI